MKKLLAGCAFAALATGNAYAQSTGSAAIEGTPEIVVTGTRTSNGVGGVLIPDVPKTRSIITAEQIERATAGQSVLQIINQIPGVNYTNTDPFGASGGNLRIRGFPGNRVALLWDGLPLNDTGNYAIFGNQTMDPELIDQISVNLGTTDVDSPTPSSAGGVVQYRTIIPTEQFGAFLQGSLGGYDFNGGPTGVIYGRISGLINTGDIAHTGVRAFFEASTQTYDKFRGPGKLNKDQYNVRFYKPLNTGNGDFVSIAAHYNKNRNVFYNNGLASDFAANRFFDYNATCNRPTPVRGTVQNDGAGSSATGSTDPNACTNYYGLRINPSNTANIRGSAKITLTDHLTFTIDPGYQYTLANGGGTTVVAENDARLRGASAAAGVDLNGDGDIIDSVRLYTPNTTRTNRYTVLTSLIYQLSDAHRFRVAYTFDRGEHRQTGQAGYVDQYGNPYNVFGGKRMTSARVLTADGLPLQSRNRFSIAKLNQVSGEYFGRFFEDKVTFTAGLRAPFFERDLNQYCYTSNATAVYGATGATTAAAIAAGGISVAPGAFYCTSAAAPVVPASAIAPYSRKVKYHPLLPSAGITFNATPQASAYLSYGRNFSAPSTDNLYRSPQVNPVGETTNSYEVGLRWRSSKLQAQLSGYWIDYKNRIVTANDVDPTSPTFNTSIDRNVGAARARGFDGQVAYRVIQPLTVSAFLDYTDSKIKNDVSGPNNTIAVYTGGKQFVETPKWQYGGRAQLNVNPFSVGASVKHVGKRYSTDDNGTGLNGAPVGAVTAIPGVIDTNGRTHGYTTVDLDGRVTLEKFGLARTYLSVSVINLFNKYYFGNLSTQNTLFNGPRFSVGSPRTIQGTIRVGF